MKNASGGFRLVLGTAFCLLAWPLIASGGLINYADLTSFQSAVGLSSHLDFSTLDDGMSLTTQFAANGVVFSDGNDTALSDSAFVTDGHGVWGHGSVSIQFSSPTIGLGVEFPGSLQIELFSGSSLIGTSQQFGGFGEGLFGGVVSTAPFDRAVISDWYDGKAFVDNLYYETQQIPTEIPDSGTSVVLLTMSCAALGALLRRVHRALPVIEKPQQA